MKIGVLAETAPGERRVALTPEGAKALRDKGFDVLVETGAGQAAGFPDESYVAVGAQIAPDAKSACQAGLVLKVLAPTVGAKGELSNLPPGTALISMLFPLSELELVKGLREAKVTSFALDLIPRITRAQSMDVLSSMSTVAGYRAALLAAEHLPKFFPMFMTAAGTIPAARAFIIGAGVAGLQAIATCKRLGAVVEAFDVRPAVKEQVESLGAKFAVLPSGTSEGEGAGGYAKELSQDTQAKVLDLIKGRTAKCDVVITTALIPGKPAPKLITKEMVAGMQRGSVIVDLAAPAGGNCECTVTGQTVVVDGVTIVGSTSLLSDMAGDSSRMFSRNLVSFIGNMAKDGELNIDMEDEVVRGTLVTQNGEVVHEATLAGMEKGAKA